MMGALCIMVGGNIWCDVTGNALMVRVGRDSSGAAKFRFLNRAGDAVLCGYRTRVLVQTAREMILRIW
ncbi:hypothetical protein E2K80_16370 [Rhodophyticola sp. CCM32]|nr:hypothetical protein E2K80_16370 [Rhodophyticola sp. CCM32]